MLPLTISGSSASSALEAWVVELTTRLKLRAEAVAWTPSADGVAVLDLGSSTYLSVNMSGRLLWEKLALGASGHEMVDLLVSEFEVDRPVAEADVRTFLTEVSERGFCEAAVGSDR